MAKANPQYNESGFPSVPDGDVQIHASTTETWTLHAQVLIRCSSVFAEMLSKENAAKLTKKAQIDVGIRWHLDLVDEENFALDSPGSGSLRLISVDSRGRVEHTHRDIQSLPEGGNGLVPSILPKYYKMVFGIMYHHDFTLPGDKIELRREVQALVAISKYLNCTSVVIGPIELACREHGQTFYGSIQYSPVLWSNIGMGLQSSHIYKDAVIHLVGQWSVVSDNAKQKLGEETKALVKKLYKQLTNRKFKLEDRVLRGIFRAFFDYPIGSDPVLRGQFQNDFLPLRASFFYLYWMSYQFLNAQGSSATDGGYALYRNLDIGGNSYLQEDELRRLCKYYPLSERAFSIVKNYVTILKRKVREIVQDSGILENNTQFNPTIHDTRGYLLCVNVKNTDCPWVKEAIRKTARTCVHAASYGESTGRQVPEEDWEDVEGIAETEETVTTTANEGENWADEELVSSDSIC